jgi:hypothetical protein
MTPKTAILIILAAGVAALIALYFIIQDDYGDPVRHLIERGTAAKPLSHGGGWTTTLMHRRRKLLNSRSTSLFAS